MRKAHHHQTTDAAIEKEPEFVTVLGSRTWAVLTEGTTTSSLHRADERVYGLVPHAFLLDVPKDAQHSGYLNPGFSTKEATILTMHTFPVNLRIQLGGIVAARSVKYLGRLEAKGDQETRDQWWTELRAEVKSHAEALLCNYVVGYQETCVIFDDVCILSATGTAAELNECKPVWKIERDEENEDKKSNEEEDQQQCITRLLYLLRYQK